MMAMLLSTILLLFTRGASGPNRGVLEFDDGPHLLIKIKVGEQRQFRDGGEKKAAFFTGILAREQHICGEPTAEVT
jgi:hypothetical protein